MSTKEMERELNKALGIPSTVNQINTIDLDKETNMKEMAVRTFTCPVCGHTFDGPLTSKFCVECASRLNVARDVFVAALPATKGQAVETGIICGAGIIGGVAIGVAGAPVSLGVAAAGAVIATNGVLNALENDHDACYEAGRRVRAVMGKLAFWKK